MPPSITGSIAQIQDSDGSFSQSVTVPADADLLLLCSAHWRWQPIDLSAATLGGISLSRVLYHDGTGVGDTLIWKLDNPKNSPGSGSQTLAGSFVNSLDEGANMFAVFLTDVDYTTGSIRDSDSANGSGSGTGTATTPTITSDDIDLGLCVGYSYGSTDCDCSVSGQSEVADSTEYNSCQGAVGTKAGSDSGITLAAYGDYSSVVGVSIRGTAAVARRIFLTHA